MKLAKRLTVEEAVKIIAAGGMIILTDDEDRENEGDFVCAARFTGPDKVNFMAANGKGLICCALEKTLCERAGLVPLDSNGGPDAIHNTRFCTPVDAIENCTTGISAFDRSITLRRLAADDCGPEDFARPGHMFPIMEADGGLETRQGHTEAAVALCRMAGLEGAAAICEIMDDDGTMARWDRLNEAAAQWNMGILTIRDLIEWRNERNGVTLPTVHGQFVMEFLKPAAGDYSTGGDHLCLVCVPNEENPKRNPDGPLVRIHSECLTGDLFGSRRCDCGRQLELALQMINSEGTGCLIYLRQEGRGIGLRAKAAAYRLQDQGVDTLEANLQLGFPGDCRDYATAAKYLQGKGISKIRLLTNNPDKIKQMEKHGITVTRKPLIVGPDRFSHRYLKTKKEKMGHQFTA